jgi:hypothetical protein
MVLNTSKVSRTWHLTSIWKVELFLEDLCPSILDKSVGISFMTENTKVSLNEGLMAQIRVYLKKLSSSLFINTVLCQHI